VRERGIGREAVTQNTANTPQLQDEGRTHERAKQAQGRTAHISVALHDAAAAANDADDMDNGKMVMRRARTTRRAPSDQHDTWLRLQHHLGRRRRFDGHRLLLFPQDRPTAAVRVLPKSGNNATIDAAHQLALSKKA
jgi:hypothetical protein